ncbi:MAG: BON domain-containing protein [Holosporales bacterium]|jgi:osmotically-inducible protein OsmY|nr:BON domain-containing protein [Holosporales bacterium]
MRFLLRILFPVSFSVIVSGCVPILVGTGVMTGGYVVIRDKRVGDSLKDAEIEAKIKKKLYKIGPQLYSDISVVADHGCVLLTGSVHNPDWISIAEKETWATDGVVVVDNCLFAGEEISASQAMKDIYITSACRTALLCNATVKSVNYKVKTMNGVVYLLGIARSNDELKLALSKIQAISGVRKIVSYVSIQKKRS